MAFFAAECEREAIRGECNVMELPHFRSVGTYFGPAGHVPGSHSAIMGRRGDRGAIGGEVEALNLVGMSAEVA
jgi:hypothetical protein